MTLEDSEARRRFALARVAHLATADDQGKPHLVPITFAIRDNVLFTPVDHKPKRTSRLRRLRNVAINPIVSVLVDHYEDDWLRLWWVRADGVARVLNHDHNQDEAAEAVPLLAAKYPQYAETPPTGTMLRVEVTNWSSWSYS